MLVVAKRVNGRGFLVLEHYKAFSAVFPVIMRAAAGCMEVLLHRRENTGFMDGMWDFAGSGHVDENETARQAVVRECGEEIGIAVKVEDVSFAHVSHRLGRDGARAYYDIYFLVRRYEGEPRIVEPHKCSEMRWFKVDGLPEDMIGIRREALEMYLEGVYYSETEI
jgi:8-oxo-dGTP diphosphatase